MTEASTPEPDALPLEAAMRLDQVCNRFEAAWRGGPKPQLEDFLGEAAGPERAALLRELVLLDVHYRRRGGDGCRPEEYRARFPALDPGWIAGALGEPAPPADGATPSKVRGLNDTTEFTPPGAPLPSFGDYELLQEVGRGGMGVVYKARQISLPRVVALKVVRAGEHAGPQELARFRSEAAVLARLQHPHIVQIYEVGEHDSRPYFSMEFVEGGSLAGTLNGTPLPPAEAAQLVEILARAMHCAHERGVVHRDLKPANVLLAAGRQARDARPQAADWVPKITDFGLAKRLDGTAGQTASGAIVGTPSYMAPEQALGKGGEVGPAADVYAVGAILHELLTGRPPFRAAALLDTVLQVVSEDPVPPRRLQSKTPRDLETVCLKCLRKEPYQRYATALALADDLRAFQEGRAVRARPLDPLARALKWAKRQPAVAALAAAILGITIVAGALVTWQWRAAVIASGETKRLLVRLSGERGQNLCEGGDIDQGMLWMAHTLGLIPAEDTALRRAIQTDLGAWAGHLHSLQRILSHPAPVAVAAFSPDGSTVLTVDENNQVRLWRRHTGDLIALFPRPGGAILATAFSADSKLALIASADGEARAWVTATGLPLREPCSVGGPVRAAAFSPDGRFVATGGDDRVVRLTDMATGKPLRRAADASPTRALTFSPDGSLLLTGSADGTARVWGVAKLRPLGQPVRPSGGQVRVVRFSPKGDTFLTVTRVGPKGGGTLVRVWRVTGEPIAVLPHRYLVKAVAFSPDGDKVLTGSEDDTARLWELTTGKPLGQPLQHQDTVEAVAFGPGGRTLLTGSSDRTARLWDAVTGKQIGQRLQHQGAVYAVAFSSDGATLLTGGEDTTARLWAVSPAEPFRGAEFKHDAQVLAVTWGRDGHSMITGTDAKAAWLWPLDGGKPLRLNHEDDVWVVAVSPDGGRVLTGSRDRTAKL